MKNKLGDNAVYVERLLPAAREKLVTIADDAPLTEAANFLREETDLAIVRCVYRKLKLGRIGGEVRPEWRVH